MMGGWYGGWWGWLLMSLMMVGFWGLLVLGAVVLLRHSGDNRGERPQADRILAERFARGEIDAEEYERRLGTLRGLGPRSGGVPTAGR